MLSSLWSGGLNATQDEKRTNQIVKLEEVDIGLVQRVSLPTFIWPDTTVDLITRNIQVLNLKAAQVFTDSRPSSKGATNAREITCLGRITPYLLQTTYPPE
jgi:hypothetical protein